MAFNFLTVFFLIGAVEAYINMAMYRQQILDHHNQVRRMEPASNMQKLVRDFNMLIFLRIKTVYGFLRIYLDKLNKIELTIFNFVERNEKCHFT